MGLAGNQRSHGAGSDKRYSTITRFLTTSFSTAQLQWLHEEGWEDGHVHQLMGKDLPLPLGIYRTPPWVRERYLEKSAPDRPIGRWILRAGDQHRTQGEGEGLGYAEAFIQIKGFTQTKLFVSQWGTDACSIDLWNQALSLLVSGILIGTKCDLLKVYPIATKREDLVPEVWSDFAQGAVVQSIMTPVNMWSYLAGVLETGVLEATNHRGLHKSFESITVFEVVPTVWWESIPGKAIGKTLHYLKVRMVSDEDRKRLRQPRSQRGRLSRFLRW